jgi:hypothetical protein
VVAAHAVCHTVAAMLTRPGTTTLPSGPVDLVLNWAIPVVLTLWAVHYTTEVASRARDAARVQGVSQTESP